MEEFFMAHTLVLPEMIAEVVAAKLGDNIKLYPLAKVEELAGKAGEVVRIPVVQYIGDATTVEAGANIPLSDFTQGNIVAEIGKAGKAVQFTEEDIVNHYLDLQGETEKQMTKAIANKIESDLFACLDDATLTANVATLDVDGLADAVVPFEEDIDDQMYLFVNPADLAVLRKDDNFIVNANHGNDEVKSVGMIFNMEVIVTNHVQANTVYIVKEEAVALYMRKDIDVEMDKNILNQTHVIVATAHYAVALNDATKAIKVTVGEEEE